MRYVITVDYTNYSTHANWPKPIETVSRYFVRVRNHSTELVDEYPSATLLNRGEADVIALNVKLIHPEAVVSVYGNYGMENQDCFTID